MEDPEVEKAVEAFDESGGRRVAIILWKDGHISICEKGTEREYSCYITSKPEGPRLFYLAQAWYSGLGMKIRKLEGGE